jgi:hypothetical protein
MDFNLDASVEGAASESKQNTLEASVDLETVAYKRRKLLSIWMDDSSDDEEEEEIVCLERLGYILILCESEINPESKIELSRHKDTMPVRLTVVGR